MVQYVGAGVTKAVIDATRFIQDAEHLPDSQVLSVVQRKNVEQRPPDESGILDSMPGEQPLTISYIATCQHGHSMIYVGPQIATLGYTQQTWLGRAESRLRHVHKDDLDRVQSALQHSCETAEKFTCRYRLYDSAGRVHWIHDEANMVCDESGEHLLAMGVMRDITNMKEMEEELNEHRYYLEKKVEQRTEELMRRIALLESCNTALCDKLAQARREIAALHRQLGSAVPGFGLDACTVPLSDMGQARVAMAGMVA